MIATANNQSVDLKKLWLDILLLGVVVGLFYAALIGGHALFTPDEGRYSEVAREMIASGDYVTPRLDGVAFLDKPALYYWLQASAIHLFGLKEWALRLWPTLMGILGCLVTYAAGHVLFNRRTGILSALLLATAPLYYGAAHYANLDLEVAVLISNSLLFFLMGINLASAKKRFALLLTAYLFAGLAALTKGLIGIAFPIMIIGAWILILNRWTILKKMHLVLGLTLFAIITCPWYFLAQKANPEFFRYFFIDQQFSRFLTKGDFNNKASFWFYIPIILLGFFPWTIFAIQAITSHVKKIIAQPKQMANELFILLWFTIVLVFFSIPKSKTVGYILPVFPALALLIGIYLESLCQQKIFQPFQRALIALMVLCGIVGFGALIAPHIDGLGVDRDLMPYLRIMSWLMLGGLLASAFLIKQHNIKKAMSVLFIFAFSFLLLLSASTGSINTRSIKPLALQLNTILKPNDEVISFYKFYYDLPLYTQRRITVVADWTASDIAENDNWVREIWYGMPFQDTSKWLIGDNTLENKWQSGKQIYVITDVNRLEDFKKIISGEIYKVAQLRSTIILSNKPLNIAENPDFSKNES